LPPVPTTPSRPFRFGVQATRTADGPAWLGLARKVEDLGYATLTMPDHFDDQFAPVPALAAAAAVTTTLRLGTLVAAVDYRHPVVLAKEMATLDVLSGGRLEVGLGAGWMTSDYAQAGLILDRPGTRIDRMVECLDVCRALWSGDPVEHHGDHYRIDGLRGLPVPVQPGGPPVLMGGGGRRMLRAAGRHADIVGINFDLRGGVIDAGVGADATPAATDRKLAWASEDAGAAWPDREVQIRVFVTQVGEDRVAVAELLAAGFGLSVEDALDSPAALVGTVDELVEQLLARRERWGFSYVVVGADAVDDFAPVVDRLHGT
jgi:probable F420-dependent oxidoreductase